MDLEEKSLDPVIERECAECGAKLTERGDQGLARVGRPVPLLGARGGAGADRGRGLYRPSSATHSMCGVCGNMSTGCTRSSDQPASTSWRAFGASVVGLQET